MDLELETFVSPTDGSDDFAFGVENFFWNLPGILNPEEWSVLTVAIRFILGFEPFRAKRERNISIRQFQDGIGRTARGTGLCRETITNALDVLDKAGILRCISRNIGKKNRYKLVAKHGEINYIYLTDRHKIIEAAKKPMKQKRTEKARATVLERKQQRKADRQRQQMQEYAAQQPPLLPPESGEDTSLSDRQAVVYETDGNQSIGQTGSSLSDRQQPVCPTDGIKIKSLNQNLESKISQKEDDDDDLFSGSLSDIGKAASPDDVVLEQKQIIIALCEKIFRQTPDDIGTLLKVAGETYGLARLEEVLTRISARVEKSGRKINAWAYVQTSLDGDTADDSSTENDKPEAKPAGSTKTRKGQPFANPNQPAAFGGFL